MRRPFLTIDAHPTRGASLIELLVVLFIIGIMMGLLLPALNNARNQAQAKVCENNLRQLSMSMQQFLNVKERLPDPGRWTIEILPWMEQRPLAEMFRVNRDPNPRFPRPPLYRCPMQDEVPSRVELVEASHYVLVVDREPNGEVIRGWDIQDLPLPEDDDGTPEPWYAGPEITYAVQAIYFDKRPGPHPPDMYMTLSGPKSATQ
jgi:prepilin-type N-terminal cleavage/methylation domain-containing protein